jgi:mitogen-activated protein kinase organizer 1
VRFTNDGKYCLTGGYDRSVRLWNPLRLDPAFPPARTTLYGDRDAIPVVDLPQALPIQVYRDGLTHPVHEVAVDEASTRIAAASDRTVVVHDVVTGQCVRRLQGHQGRVNAVAISKGADIYLSASYDATVRLWDGRSRSHAPLQILTEAKDSVTAVHTVQGDATAVICTASVDGEIRTYDLRRGLLQCDRVASPITGMCPSRDARGVVVNCLDGALRLLDLQTGRMVQHYADHHRAGQYALDCAVAAEDTAVVTGSEDGSAVVYDWTTGQVRQVLQGHSQPTCSVAMHPKADLASVTITDSFDGTAVVWGHDTGLMQWQD